MPDLFNWFCCLMLVQADLNPFTAHVTSTDSTDDFNKHTSWAQLSKFLFADVRQTFATI